jgi:hypothetical protein
MAKAQKHDLGQLFGPSPIDTGTKKGISKGGGIKLGSKAERKPKLRVRNGGMNPFKRSFGKL